MVLKTQRRASASEPLEDRSLHVGRRGPQWNEVLLQSLSARQHAASPAGPRTWPSSTSAMFDAVNALDRSYELYLADVLASRGASQEAAAAQAAHDTLVALYPARQAIYDATLAEDLAGIPDGKARQGVAIGQEVARQILALRRTTGPAPS